MPCAATLGAALSDFVAFQIVNSTGASVYLRRTEDVFVLGYGAYSGAVSPQMHDAVLAIGHGLVRELTRGAVRPLEFISMRPPPRDPAPWARLAGVPFRFGQTKTCLVLPRAALDFRLATADRETHDALAADLAAHLARASWGRSQQVAHALRALLIGGRSNMPDVARRLGTTPRTLRRALAREGATFEAIRDAVRFSTARELLILTRLPIGDIAITLNFATPSAFVRAFRRWSETSPAAWRQVRSSPERKDLGASPDHPGLLARPPKDPVSRN
jgi:AraC-like DNA-binding protein